MGEAAKFANVSAATMRRLFDEGELKGFRIPGSQWRRTTPEQLRRCLVANMLPTTKLDAAFTKTALLVTQDAETVERLRGALTHDPFQFETVGSGFDAGTKVRSAHPFVLLIDTSIGRMEALRAAQRCRSNSASAGIHLIAILPFPDEPPLDDPERLFAAQFHKPVDVASLVGILQRLLGGR